jgi:hypothetical protein
MMKYRHGEEGCTVRNELWEKEFINSRACLQDNFLDLI